MSEKKTVLLVEDDSGVRAPMRTAFEAAGYRVLEADLAAVGLNEFRTKEPDLVVLDVELPDGTGLEVCKSIRAHKTLSKTPVIMLTGRGELDQKGEGFGAGADHYLVKPVHPRELLLWAGSLLRRAEPEEEGELLEAGDLSIDRAAMVVRFKGEPLPKLTVKELELLYFLVRKRPGVLSRKHILSTLWRTVAVDHVVDTHIGNLRKKLPPEVSDRIQNVPGKGFRYFA
ncbi:MAG: two-component system, OmpR family, alkaline phosphatase synthesis response regulator PhoP [Elusimicrobia bacterium]|nr:MAG: two-component system, OmpR family, alkaline phosphatase synthesis response regulator PhoP [Elusimicrobiota bacterium]